MVRSLSVWWNASHVGRVSAEPERGLVFVYDPTWVADGRKPPISTSLGKRVEPYGAAVTRQVFGSLLPRGSARLAVAKALGISTTHSFRLLEALGGDLAGALCLGQSPPLPGLATAMPLSDGAMVRLLQDLAQPIWPAELNALRVALPGAQPKLPVVLAEGRVALAAPGQPTTHILKTSLDGQAETLDREVFAMRLAAALGLPVASMAFHRHATRRYLLLSRFDRRALTDGSVSRLHQESFRQRDRKSTRLNSSHRH